MRKIYFLKVALFAVLVLGFLFSTLTDFGQIKTAEACSSGYGYNSGYDFGCGSCCGNYGYQSYQPYQTYQPYPTYQYVYYPQTYRSNNNPISQYNYVQYPYYSYVYFQNPAPARSTTDTYNYVQYPYQQYVYNR